MRVRPEPPRKSFFPSIYTTHGGVDHTAIGHVQERFDTRARALVYARLALMTIGLLVLAIPSWRRALHVTAPQGVLFYLGLLVCHVVSYLWMQRRHAPVVIFCTLCIDLLALMYLVIISGGMRSSLMPAQLIFTMLFTLIFPSPLAIIPPLLTLPIVSAATQALTPATTPADILLVLWFTALNVTVVYVVVYLDGRETTAFREVLALQRERRREALALQRSRIAREIHDGVGAALSGIMLQAEYLASQVSGETRREVTELRESATDGIDELRRAVSILHREFELAVAVPDYAGSFGARHRIEVSVDVEGREPELEQEEQLALFRILQEALSNIARHARASRVKVRLRFEPQEVSLVVDDDGCGFTPESKLRNHYGLRNMSERAGKLRGEVRVISAPGQGARIEVRIPLAGRGPAA